MSYENCLNSKLELIVINYNRLLRFVIANYLELVSLVFR